MRAARACFARVSGLVPDGIDAALDGRGDEERWRWISDAVGHDEHALVSGWLLSSIRDRSAREAPVPAARLLAIACDLAAPVAIALHQPDPDAEWVGQAIQTGAELVRTMPRHPVAVVASAPLLERALASSKLSSTALAMARAGRVEVEAVDVGARSHAEQTLFDALGRDRRTAHRFALNARVAVDVTYEVDLVASRSRIAIEIDGWYHFREPEGYRRDRRKDLALQQGGYLVMRFLADDVEARLELVVDEVALAVAARERAGLR